MYYVIVKGSGVQLSTADIKMAETVASEIRRNGFTVWVIKGEMLPM